MADRTPAAKPAPTVTQVSITSRGMPSARNEDQATAVDQASAKWDSHQSQVDGLPWSKVPDAMLEDFARAAAADMDTLYGTDAPAKVLALIGQDLAPLLTATPPPCLSAAWSASPARLEVSFALRAEDPQAAASPDAQFELDVPEGVDDDQVRQALRDWANSPDRTRLSFDPVATLPASDLKALCARLEDLLGRAVLPPGKSDMNVLYGVAGVLLCWRKMETMQALENQITLSGITSRGKEVFPGQSLVITARRTPLEPENQPVADPTPTQSARVTVRRH